LNLSPTKGGSGNEGTKSARKLTRFERARVIGLRALQLTLGAPPLVAMDETPWDPLEVATKELVSGLLPLSLRRTFPDGSYVDVPLSDLV
jgi:DNA-directed RNA polymerase I, II, and III subunit RPABC2